MKPAHAAVALVVAALVAYVIATSLGGDGPTQHQESSMSDSNPAATPPEGAETPRAEVPAVADDGTELATFGAGCFWCVEAVFTELAGVKSVVSGYMGGHVEGPTYKAVCEGITGHAEVAQIRFDPKRVSFDELLEVFWKTHDPTTLNRQGADQGTQYRSAVFAHSEAQQKIAEAYKARLDASGAFSAPVVTEIVPAQTFYPAEDYHQDYYAQNPNGGYCRAVIAPKIEKFRKVFESKLKSKK